MEESLLIEHEILASGSFADIRQKILHKLFKFQYRNNEVYKKFVDCIDANLSYPFLPISAFKNHVVKSGKWRSKIDFESSGTTSINTSKHAVKSLELYRTISQEIFEEEFGSLKGRPVLALLPSYLERPNSSLIYMVNHFMTLSGHAANNYIQTDFEQLYNALVSLQKEKGILIGVSFALLDFAERYQLDLSNWEVFETGGMKGRREEILRKDLHGILCRSFNKTEIFSEYGMTELSSQAYSKGMGVFNMNKYLRAVTVEIDDPFQTCEIGRLGRLCFIDVGNLHTVSFIATDDIGRLLGDNQFTVEGRIDNSDIRGCNLLYH